MKMAKPTESDLDAAGACMAILQDADSVLVSSGADADEDEERDLESFDPDNIVHLRKFYDAIQKTLTASPSWPGRVIGGMCYVIMFDKNKIVDPDSRHLELHPDILAALAKALPTPSSEGTSHV